MCSYMPVLIRNQIISETVAPPSTINFLMILGPFYYVVVQQILNILEFMLLTDNMDICFGSKSTKRGLKHFFFFLAELVFAKAGFLSEHFFFFWLSWASLGGRLSWSVQAFSLSVGHRLSSWLGLGPTSPYTGR